MGNWEGLLVNLSKSVSGTWNSVVFKIPSLCASLLFQSIIVSV